MGLDMYLRGERYYMNRPHNERGTVISDTLDMGYWRKHPNLHGYIVQHFANGEDKCQQIQLDTSDIRQIMEAVQAKDLPETDGFFFGKSDGSDEEIARDLNIFSDALYWLEHEEPGIIKSIYYRASW